jgi:phage terminase large subunit-like protein
MATPFIIETLKPITPAKIAALVEALETDEMMALLSDWELWSLPYQQIPPGDWRRWVFRAGRGTGKTYTGSRTTNEVAKDRSKIKRGEIALWGRTHADARFTMVEGPSGILATAPPDFRPKWEPGNGSLTWPNGIRGRILSADRPEQGRGVNAAWVWADEPAHWPDFGKTWWEVVEPGLRIGWARAMLTTTPLPASELRDLEEKPGSVVTRASTFDNAYLSKTVRDALRSHYEGTRIGRQELLGEYLAANENALWDPEMIEGYRVKKAPIDLRRVVVAVDPAVTAHKDSDETGIVVAGIDARSEGYVIADKTLKGSPHQWGKMAVACYHRFKADAIVVEVNNGGDLVESNIRGIDKRVKVKSVRASRGKVTRAEPVAALYERGLIHHVGALEALEDQMLNWDPLRTSKSPDRIDALVWAFHELLLQEKRPAGPLRAYL